MSKITKKEWEIINSAMAYFETVLFDDDNWPDKYPQDTDLTAQLKYTALRNKVLRKIYGN